ncbi:MAG: hypothetical protein WCX14_02375 [Dysgonamonadaceae bacterium]
MKIVSVSKIFHYFCKIVNEKTEMSKKKIIIRILLILIGLIAAASIYFYFTLPEWKAFYIAGSGVVLILNLIFALFFINRNFKN